MPAFEVVKDETMVTMITTPVTFMTPISLDRDTWLRHSLVNLVHLNEGATFTLALPLNLNGSRGA